MFCVLLYIVIGTLSAVLTEVYVASSADPDLAVFIGLYWPLAIPLLLGVWMASLFVSRFQS